VLAAEATADFGRCSVHRLEVVTVRGASTAAERLDSVLVVEQDRCVAALVARALRAGGYRVVTASCESEALAALKAARFDLVLTDSVGHDDHAEATTSTSWRHAPRRLLLTGGNPLGFARLHQGLPTSAAVLQKPFTIDDLLQAVGSALGAEWSRRKVIAAPRE